MIGLFLTTIVKILLSLRYKIRIEGRKEILKKGNRGILILPNHPALIDPIIMVSHFYRCFRPKILADKDQVDFPVIRSVSKKLNVIAMPDPAVYGEGSRKEVEAAIRECIEYLKGGGNVLLYPSGRTYYSRLEEIGGNSSVETILKELPDIRIALVNIRGLWGSSFSRSTGVRPQFFAELIRGAKKILVNEILFTPRRSVTIVCREPDDFPRHNDRNVINRYLEEFYNADAPYNTYVPYTIFEKGGIRIVPEPEMQSFSGDIERISQATRDLVMEKLTELTGVTNINPDALLSRDLGMDSLVKVELMSWIESDFGFTISDPETLNTVTDVLLASSGTTVRGSMKQLHEFSSKWFESSEIKRPLVIPDGETVTDVFLRKASASPGRILFADQTRGTLSYRNIVLAVMVLKPLIESFEGEYIGIMLPAVSSVAPLYLAVLFAGKVPVMVNWTAGSRNMRHSLDSLGVKKILTSAVFLQKIESQGILIDDIRDKFVLLEDAAKGISIFRKLAALVKSRTSWRSLAKAKIQKTAVVLFTSGSENFPKSVPLTHENILTNLRDVLESVDLYPDDKMIGILPPFHSFGLTVTTVLPLCSGIRVIYHPNPTEGRMISRLINAYKVTMLIGTPTFLDGVVRASDQKDLESLRLVVSGAEKCPLRLYDEIGKRWKGMKILEGYGITECSPVVSVNREDEIKPGTIGRMLPSIEYVLRDIDTGERVQKEKPGMLLVRGKSIFGGYLHFDGPSPFEEFEGKLWYRTGDLVVESDEGIITFSGRLKRFVKLGGEMVSLPAIEEVLLHKFQQPDIDTVLAVESTASESNPEIVLFTTIDLSRESANTAIKEAGLSPIHNIRMVKHIEKIPVLGTGKTDYRQLKALL